jgi:hypothetical protein
MCSMYSVLCDLPAQHGGMCGEDSGHINLPHPDYVVNDGWKPNMNFVLYLWKGTENKSLKQLNLVTECWKLLCFVQLATTV